MAAKVRFAAQKANVSAIFIAHLLPKTPETCP
jgi:hypothetical protein